MNSLAGQAAKYRLERQLAGGVVVFFDGELNGWMNQLRDPQTWRPGCIALDEQGNQWKSVGGNDYDGAREWVPVIISPKTANAANLDSENQNGSVCRFASQDPEPDPTINQIRSVCVFGCEVPV